MTSLLQKQNKTRSEQKKTNCSVRCQAASHREDQWEPTRTSESQREPRQIPSHRSRVHLWECIFPWSSGAECLVWVTWELALLGMDFRCTWLSVLKFERVSLNALALKSLTQCSGFCCSFYCFFEDFIWCIPIVFTLFLQLLRIWSPPSLLSQLCVLVFVF